MKQICRIVFLTFSASFMARIASRISIFLCSFIIASLSCRFAGRDLSLWLLSVALTPVICRMVVDSGSLLANSVSDSSRPLSAVPVIQISDSDIASYEATSDRDTSEQRLSSASAINARCAVHKIQPLRSWVIATAPPSQIETLQLQTSMDFISKCSFPGKVPGTLFSRGHCCHQYRAHNRQLAGGQG